MSKDDFEAIRRAPKERAAQFVPEVLLVRSMKESEEQKKAFFRLTEDAFRDSAAKLFPTLDPADVTRMFEDSRRLRHVDDLDPHILVIASYLRARYPGGLNFEAYVREGTLGPIEMASEEVLGLAHSVLEVNENPDIELLPRIKADILTYYQMYFI